MPGPDLGGALRPQHRCPVSPLQGLLAARRLAAAPPQPGGEWRRGSRTSPWRQERNSTFRPILFRDRVRVASWNRQVGRNSTNRKGGSLPPSPSLKGKSFQSPGAWLQLNSLHSFLVVWFCLEIVIKWSSTRSADKGKGEEARRLKAQVSPSDSIGSLAPHPHPPPPPGLPGAGGCCTRLARLRPAWVTQPAETCEWGQKRFRICLL